MFTKNRRFEESLNVTDLRDILPHFYRPQTKFGAK